MKGGKWETPDLVKSTGYSNSSCYNACRTLEKKGLVTSYLHFGGCVFWDPVTRLVLTKSNFAYINIRRERVIEAMKKEVMKKYRECSQKSKQSIQNDLSKFLGIKVVSNICNQPSITKIREAIDPIVDYDIPNWWINENLIKLLSLILCLLA